VHKQYISFYPKNRQSELYIYGGMDFDSSSVGYISRDQITFEELLKSGHFANIYKARYNGKVVVAKTLKGTHDHATTFSIDKYIKAMPFFIRIQISLSELQYCYVLRTQCLPWKLVIIYLFHYICFRINKLK